MSLQMNLVFGTLIFQMVILSFLLLPLPHRFRVHVLDLYDIFMSSTNCKVGLVFSTSLLGLSFFDCIRRLQKFDNFGNQPYFTTFNANASGSLSYDQLATKFYTQRNLYLNGAVLYLVLSIFTIITVLKKLVKKETEYRSLKALDKGEFANEQEELDKYRTLIKQKEVDIKTFKKQLQGLQSSYDGLTPGSKTTAKKSE